MTTRREIFTNSGPCPRIRNFAKVDSGIFEYTAASFGVIFGEELILGSRIGSVCFSAIQIYARLTVEKRVPDYVG